MKRYLTSQASLEMAHRNIEGELVGRVYSQQGLQTKNPHTLDLGSPADTQSQQNSILETPNEKQNSADNYNPNHPQIVRFYRKWGKRE